MNKVTRNKLGRFVKGTKGYSPWTGKKRGKWSDEHKQKIAKKMKGVKKTDKHRENIAKSKVGEKNPSYKNGTTKDSYGYLLVLKPKHPNANVNRRVALHRLVVEKYLGRYLKKEEHIHHIDFDIENNNIDNLYIVNNKKHQKLHGELGKLIGRLIKERIIIFNKREGKYERA